MKASCRKLKEFVKDEEKGVAEYNRYGYPDVAKQEERHKSKFEREIKKRCK